MTRVSKFRLQVWSPAAVFLVLGAGLTGAPAGRLLLDETFSDGERTMQKPPVSAGWFTSSTESTLTVGGPGLVQQGGGRHVLAYFTEAAEPVRLSEGEALKLTYEMVLQGPMDGSGSFRVGLLNSGGARIAGDKQVRSGAYAGYRGYVGLTNPVPTKNPPLRLAKRTGALDTLVAEIAAYTLLGEPAGPLQTMRDGEAVTGTLLIKREGENRVSVTHGYSGGGLDGMQVVATDEAAPEFTFDTVVVHAGTKAAAGFTLRSVKIELFAAE